MSSTDENKLVPKLRFPEFNNDGGWNADKVGNLILTITPPKKLLSSNYLPNGDYPIIDQSKSFYCGWTNDKDAIITNDLPLIVFGDHTCILKLAYEPFAQGADGIKILKSNELIDRIFIYHFIIYNPVKQEEYKRHFSILKEKIVLFPNIKTGEQQKIASFLSSLDKLINGESQKLEELKAHKKGLMQNLFPQEDEKVPRIRFKEFKKSGEWGEKKLEEISENVMYGMNSAAVEFDGENKYIRITDIDEDTRSFTPNPLTSPEGPLEERYSVNVGDLLFARTGASVGKSYLHRKENGKIYFAGFLIRFTIKDAIPYFVYAQTLTNHYQKWILATSVRSGQPGINAEEYKSYPIFLPPDKERKEQQKISDCLLSLDDIIKAQSQKIETLKEHKKSLMQNLFPNFNGVSV
ncbi:MAG: restriction endonuclease subunit S [Ignavibacteriaceae bacterium]|nr:restriction endonuclease subunit S [Ignavibacteriaceae bacterium]